MCLCDVCGGSNTRNELVSEIFEIDGRRVVLENIPARVCPDCGEITFDNKTAERVRQVARGEVEESDVLQQLDNMRARLVEENASFDEAEVADDVVAAIQEARSKGSSSDLNLVN